MRRALPVLLCAFAGCQCNPGPLFDAGSGTLWVSSRASGRLMVLDAADGGLVGQLSLRGDGGRGAAVTASSSGEWVFVADEAAGTVDVVDVHGLRVRSTITNLAQPRDVQPSPNGQVLYVAQAGSDHLAAVDLGSLQVSRVPASGGASPSATESVWVTREGTVYVVNQLASRVVKLGYPSRPARWALPVALNPTRLVVAQAGGVGYVAGAADGVVQQVFLPEEGMFPDAGVSVPVGDSPVWMSLSQDDRWLVVSNGRVDNTISVLDLSQGFIEQGKVVVGGGGVGHNVLSPGGSIAYVAVGLPPQVAVVDLERRMVVGTYPLPEAPRGLTYVPPLSRR